MCNCVSSNMQDIGAKGTKEAILNVPSWMVEVDRATVCVDYCIKDAILHLWNNKIPTLNCCCGHNESNPIIVVPLSVDPKIVMDLLKEIDDRDFGIARWEGDKLVEYFEVLTDIKLRGMEWSEIRFIKRKKYEGEK